MDKNSLTPKTSGITFTLAVLFPYILFFFFSFAVTVYGGAEKTPLYFYIAGTVTFIANTFVAVFMMKSSKCSLKSLKVNKIDAKSIGVSLIVFLGLFLFVAYISKVFSDFLLSLGVKYSGATPPLGNGLELILSVFFFALLPAFSEELLFRGVILSGLEKSGKILGAILVGLLFALFHQSPFQFVYPFIAGAVFSLVVIKTGSLISSFIIHFLNNVLVLILTYFNVGSYLETFYFSLIGLVILSIGLYLLFRINTEKEEKTEKVYPLFIYGGIGILVALFFIVKAVIV